MPAIRCGASFDMLENYLITQGREWERYAWIKARCITGGETRALMELVLVTHPEATHVVDGLVLQLTDRTMRPVARWREVALLRAGMGVADCRVTTAGTPVQPHRGAYADALAHLHAGGRVWIAPEGGWQPDVALRPPRTGATRLAHAASVPIQVLAILHTPHPGPDVRTLASIGRSSFRRPRVVLRWGPCLTATGGVRADGHRLMTAIAETAGMTWRSTAHTTAATLDRSAASPAH